MPVVVAPSAVSGYSLPLTARWCEYRSTWAGTWTLLPYAVPVSCSDDALPGISSAQVTRWLGNIYESGMSASQTFTPVDLRDKYIRIRIQYPNYQPVTVWTGIVTECAFDVEGVSAGRNQNIQAYGLAYLLNRIPLNRSYVKEGTLVNIVEHLIPFNKRHSKGRTLFGNRSTDKDSTLGCYMFSSDGAVWSNRDIVEYYLKTADFASIDIGLTGTATNTTSSTTGAGSLSVMKDEHNQSGTAWSMITSLIDRRHGMCGRIDVEDDGKVNLYVDTVTQAPITFGTKTLQANTNQVNFTFPSTSPEAHLVDPVELRFTTATKWDKIVVQSQRLVSMFTADFADVLQKGWTTTLEGDYRQTGTADPEAADLARTAHKYRDVYQRFVVKKQWNFIGYDSESIVVPLPKKDGKFDDAVSAETSLWQFDKVFERTLPILKGVKYDEDGAAQFPQSHTDNDPDTEPEFRPMMVFIRDSFEGQMHANDDKWKLIDKIGDLHSGLHNLSATPLDKEMGFRINSSPNHYLAGGNFSINPGIVESMSLPELSYVYLAVTAAITTDVRARVEKKMSQVTENSKTLYITVEGSEFWYAAKKTVVDIRNGSLFKVHDNNRWLRADKEKLEQVMAFTAAHYGIERQAVSIPIKFLGLFVPLCSYLTSISGLYAPYQVGTVVSSRKMDFINNETTIETGWNGADAPIEPVLFDPKSPFKGGRGRR